MPDPWKLWSISEPYEGDTIVVAKTAEDALIIASGCTPDDEEGIQDYAENHSAYCYEFHNILEHHEPTHPGGKWTSTVKRRFKITVEEVA